MFGAAYPGQNYAGQAYAERSVVFDAASSSGYEASLSSYSWSHTCGLSARGLLVNVSIFATGTVSTVTYNSVALTFIRSDTVGVYRNEVWALIGPAYGSHTVAVTLSTSLTSISSALSYGNVNQNSMIEASTGATGVGGTPTLSVSTASAFAWVMSGITTSNGAVTPASGQRSRANSSGALGSGAGADAGPITAPASTAVNWSAVGGLDSWVISAIALDPFEDAAIFLQAASATQTQTLVTVRSAGKIVSATETQSLSAIRSIGKPVSVTQVQASSIVRSAVKIASVVQTQTLAVLRSIGKPINVTQTQTLATVRAIAKTLSLTQTQSLTALVSRAFLQSVVATQTQLATMRRSTGKILSKAQAQTSTITSHFALGQVLSVVQSQTLAAVRSIGKTFALSETQTPTSRRGINKPILVAQTQSPSVVRSVAKVLSVVGAQVVTLLAQFGGGAHNIFNQALTAVQTQTPTSVQTFVQFVASLLRMTVRNDHRTTHRNDQRVTFRQK